MIQTSDMRSTDFILLATPFDCFVFQDSSSCGPIDELKKPSDVRDEDAACSGAVAAAFD